MNHCKPGLKELSPQTLAFYRKALIALCDSKIPFLVGGGYAFRCYTGIARDTKDLDVFVRPRDVTGILETLHQAGYATELTDELWLGKAIDGDGFVDIIFCSANGLAPVCDDWFAYANEVALFDIAIELIPPEEMIWSKAFVMTRDRYDGADIAHIILALAETIDWKRLFNYFGDNWRVLYNHLILFGYMYPSERNRIPARLMRELADRLRIETDTPPPIERVCRGTFLSPTQFAADVGKWGFRDPRPVLPKMSLEEGKV